MSAATAILAGLFGLPGARNSVAPYEEVDLITADNVSLRTRIYHPAEPGNYPTLLMRVPYGFAGFGTVAELYAEHGFHSVLQECRGTGESGGVFDPLRHERNDGLATLNWIYQQAWYDGRIGLTGPSYLGYAQWAVCDELPETAAMATKVSSAEFESIVFPGGAFALQLWLSWLQVVEGLTEAPMTAGLQIVTGDIERRTRRAADTLPLVGGDVEVTGHKVPFWRDWFANAIDNPAFWAPLDHRDRMSASTPPNHFVSGWYDFMVDQLIRDYHHLVELGHTPYLTVGTWHHISAELQAESMRETLPWMRTHLHGDTGLLRANPVRIHISGGVGWAEFGQFPPPGGRRAGLHLHEGFALHSAPPEDGQPVGYVYDPADPTPSEGGAFFAFSGAGPVENRQLEAREDVLTFTTTGLVAPVTVIGQPKVTLFARSSSAFTDFFVRLCDVTPSGQSTNICDAIVRVEPGKFVPDGNDVLKIEIALHHCAHRFARGNRIRLQVSSGAHPRFARNPGTGEPIGTAVEMQVQRQLIFHDSAHPSRIELPVYDL